MAIILSTSLFCETNGTIFCANHPYETSINTLHMQFTKEVVEREYAIEGEFKGLHCCAKGYNSLEW
jgi:hypothetical protein